MCRAQRFVFFFFNDTATTEIYTLSLHDALPISDPCRNLSPSGRARPFWPAGRSPPPAALIPARSDKDRKSTRLNSSHDQISYAVFCLKKKNSLPASYCHQDEYFHRTVQSLKLMC